MNDLQKKILNLIKWFSRFCENNNLTYFMLGGTMLGAVRHHGFIPWDDDADFGMPREDYEKFIELTFNKKIENVEIESCYNNKNDFPYYILKIYDPSTTLIEKSKESIVRGVFIDVFPIDGAGKTEKECLQFQRKCFGKINFYNAKRFTFSKKRSFLKNAVVFVAKFLPPYRLNHAKISKKLNDLVSQKPYKTSCYLANFFGSWQKKETMQKEIYGCPVKYIFENLELYGPSDYEKYLNNLYGNYMELPPIQQRGEHHDFILCDLSTPYSEYSRK